MFRALLPVLLLVFSLPSLSQPRTFEAVKVLSPPRIDGILNDPSWQQALILSNFTQNYPDFGKPSIARTEVKILYDNDAVYVSAYLFDDPALVRKQLTARDGESRQDVDFFSVFFDTYNDQQNAFQFLVTSANVQSDARLSGGGSQGFGDFGDKSWDAVWDSKTNITSDGWIVEMRIPYISLRFAKTDVQTWGLQLLRSIRRANEASFWNPVDPNVGGLVNQFGKMTSLQQIEPPLRLSFSPYISSGVRVNPEGSSDRTELLGSGGMDVKYGINESFTLDATLIPDFGQVVSDNVVNNLTPFEVRFQENRPFFTEGTELFNKAGLFYSRRIGATPSGYGKVENLYRRSDDYEIIRNPALTRLYNAIKFSGRNSNNLGIGIFNAVTAPMKARVRNNLSNTDSMIVTEPVTNYNIIVLDQALKGRSSITFTNTSVVRNGRARDANVAGLGWALYNTKNTHSLSGYFYYSTILGNSPFGTAHFMNTDTVMVGGQKVHRPYDGYTSFLRFAKVSGKIRYNAYAQVKSTKYDPNDLGYLSSPNEVLYQGAIGYYQYDPTGNFINYNYTLNAYSTYLYQPYRFSQVELSAQAFWLFKNFWDLRFVAGGQPVWQTNYFELQTPGYSVKKPWFYYLSVEGSTDSRKRLYVNYELAFAEGELEKNPYFKTEAGARYRFSDRLSVDLQVDRVHDHLQIGYAFQNEPDGRPIAAFRNNLEFTTVLTGIYNFTPRINFSIRGRHYWNKVKYLSFWNVDDKGNHIPRAFIPDADENVNIFNVDAFFNWDFKPGSRMVAGWKNWLGRDYLFSVDGRSHKKYGQNLQQLFDLPHGNEFTLKVIYFLDYNQLRRGKF